MSCSWSPNRAREDSDVCNAGIIWIPYGWGANDPVGLRHAIARAIGCYLAYWFAPAHLKPTAICAVVALAYVYSLAAMRKPG